MSIKRINKKIIHIYCEGASEKNYFEALKGNNIISTNYVLKPNSKENDLENALEKSKRLSGVMVISIFIYDSDSYYHHKQITNNIKNNKKYIYFSDKNFEDFLNCHNTKPPYKCNKPHLSRHLIEEIRNLTIPSIKKLRRPDNFKEFKSFYDLLMELFENKF